MTAALAAMAAAAMLASPRHAAAADADKYPQKPIRLVVAYAPGGVTDGVTRILALELSKVLGQTVIVDNRAGAGGTIGAGIVAKAEPDGYTLLATSPPQIAVAPLLMPVRPYDAARDFTQIGTFVTTPNILVVNPSVPAKNLAELVAYAKGAGKGKLSYSSGGPGSTGQLNGQTLCNAAGIQMVEVPYSASSSMAFPDLIAGRVDANFGSLPSTIGFVRSGQVRPIVVMSSRRSPTLPDVPTVSEAGYPAAAREFWQGIEGPAHMPAAIVAKLNAAIRTAMASPSVIKGMENLGAQPYLMSPEAFTAMRDRDLANYKKLVAQLGLAATN
ncbi:tripartite tricarboxylate transporter substrate binding protein [Pigmentiphaga soli]|uniref:Tripartite tricarboxylate transporter substrate binding protein n=1 Tax=Pigmentiphaga soli TaxID=1007095 RepID=A0ABP8HF63_9BURK